MSTLRWTVLVIAFIVLTYGGLVGISLGDFLPTFACWYVGESRGGDCFLWHVQHHFSGHGGPGYLVRPNAPMLLYFFLLLLVLGKAWCGWICPLGFIMDVLDLARRRLNMGYLFFSQRLRARLAPIKWVLLFLSLVVPLSCFPFFMRSQIASDLSQPYCQWCPAKYVVPLCVGNVEEIAVNFRSGVGIFMTAVGLVVAGLFLIGALTKRRFWCSFCPMGLVIGLCRKISIVKLKKNCQACTRCGICYNVCPLDIEEIFTERTRTNVTYQDCILCMKCIENCPEEGVLSATFCGRTIYRATQKGFFSNPVASGRRARQEPAVGAADTISADEGEPVLSGSRPS
ncbi:MAG: 4Fe-4S binding protein [Planctomycetaceae bacterium]|nr:4Fe-4S binding protein [Planctomycetaceae bacterium]